ncbi:hypothetical protein U8335_21085 [Roseiconus lacunae]|uniref:hypothetical protein n=1 Tax=Roseiconus lacunae TaxID=2605694 RepID=UPI003089E1C3|nr:hypothetical protein U8335_21085 [Stieleria sp. HD01]
MLFGSANSTHLAATSSRFAGLSLGRTRRSVAYVGVDLSETYAKIACLRENRNGGFDWTQQYRWKLPAMASNEPSTTWLDDVLKSLADRLPRPIDGDVNLATVALPMSWTQYQTALGHELDQVHRRSDAIFRHSVFASDSAVCHWPVTGAHLRLPDANSQYVTAATAQRASCQIAAVITSLGYQVRSVLPHAVALTHASFQLTGIDAQCVLWLDRSSALIAVRHRSGVGLARSLPSLPTHLDTPDVAVRLDAYALRPYLSDIAGEYHRTADYVARSENASRSQKPILIAGSLAGIVGVDEVLATLCNVPIATWTFRSGSRPTPPSNSACVQDLQLDSDFASALSLAYATTRTSKRGYGK